MTISSTEKKRRAGIGAVIAGVGAAHVVLFALLGAAGAPPPDFAFTPAINVELIPPVLPRPTPPPEPEPTPEPGGGAPAAPSVVHVTARQPPKPTEVPAPPRPAPEQPLVVGASDQATPTPGPGQGGEGTGSGTGQGEGDGPGSGSGPIILRGASNGEILQFVPPEARRRRIPGRASVSCVVRSDTRLDDCRVVSENPPGLGFGDAGRQVAETYFRFRPPTTASGRPVEGFRATVVVLFGRQ